jgi:hypothetical protein
MIAIIAALKDEVRDIIGRLEEDEVVRYRPSTIYRESIGAADNRTAISSVGSSAITHSHGLRPKTI